MGVQHRINIGNERQPTDYGGECDDRGGMIQRERRELRLEGGKRKKRRK